MSSGSAFLEGWEEIERTIFEGLLATLGERILRGSREELLEMEERLRGESPRKELPEDPEEVGEELLRELELENLLRVFAHYRGVEQRSVSGTELGKKLGVKRQWLKQLRDSKRLLGLRLPFRESFYYPVWQFTGTGSPIEAMTRLIGAAEEAGMDPADLDAFMVGESAGGGTPPYKVLAEGHEERVLSWIPGRARRWGISGLLGRTQAPAPSRPETLGAARPRRGGRLCLATAPGPRRATSWPPRSGRSRLLR